MCSGDAIARISVAGGAARSGGALEAFLIVAMLYALTQGTEALAADMSTDVIKEIQPIVGGTPLSSAFVPGRSQTFEPQYSASDFRQRPRMQEAPVSGAWRSLDRNEPMRSTSAWQRLADYRSQGRVQLLTLWQSSRSIVSLQTGKHGGPSLQWSSRLMNRGGATRGLLDRFVASSLDAAGLGSKAAARSANPPAANKAVALSPASKAP